MTGGHACKHDARDETVEIPFAVTSLVFDFRFPRAASDTRTRWRGTVVRTQACETRALEQAKIMNSGLPMLAVANAGAVR